MKVVYKDSVFEHLEVFLKTYLDHLDVTVVVGSLHFTKDDILDLKSKGVVVLYNVEQIDPSYTFSGVSRPIDFLDNFRLYDDVWDYDLINIQRLSKIGISAKYLPLMYVNRLERIPSNTIKTVDCLFYGSINEKRQLLLNEISKVCNLRVISGALGKSLDNEISNAKIILNCHYVDWDIQEQIRMFYPIINKKLVISEYNSNNVLDGCIFNVDRKDMAEAVRYALTKDIDSIGMKFYNNFKNKYINFDFSQFGVK